MTKKAFAYLISGFILCIILEYLAYNINHKYRFFEPIFSTTATTTASTNSVSYEKREGGGVFTNPLLECLGVGNDESSTQLNINRFQLNDLVSKITSSGRVQFMSVYIRDLNNGPWIGINEREEFIGGSLLKVPILISFLKTAEKDPGILKKVIQFKKKNVTEIQYFTPSKQIEVGKKYTVEELLNDMIEYSDNEAAYILFENINMDDFNEVFKALGFGEPNPNLPYPVNTKTYAGFFRILFNASYLNRDSSEKALKILSTSEFDRGITEPLPKSITVSHKFGTRSDGDVNQLHDCGIVYYPGHPYLICVMSRGGTFDNMASSISQVSKFVYDQVSQIDEMP